MEKFRTRNLGVGSIRRRLLIESRWSFLRINLQRGIASPMAAFFKHYKSEGFDTPPLTPEFENPVFLKLVCEWLHRRGLRWLPVSSRHRNHP